MNSEKNKNPRAVNYDYFSNDYNSGTSKINLYYRKIIEDLHLDYERKIDKLKFQLIQIKKTIKKNRGGFSQEEMEVF